MVNYQEGKIYKIYSTIDDSICYVGSTTKTLLCQRMIQHRKDYKTWKEGKKDKVTSYDLFDRFGLENCIIELLLLYPCNSKDELNKKEGEFIRNLNCVNKIIAGRTPKQYREDNAEKLKEKDKIYRDNNKEKIKEKDKIYRENNKDKIKEKDKVYRENNIDKIREKDKIRKKIYRDDNKEIISEKKKEKMTCECGSCFRKNEKAKHYRTLKHINYIQNLNSD